jgi:hypothetical protein
MRNKKCGKLVVYEDISLNATSRGYDVALSDTLDVALNATLINKL